MPNELTLTGLTGLEWKLDPTTHFAEVDPELLAGLLGFIPGIILGRHSAEEEVNAGYAHGGGWHSFSGFSMDHAGVMSYSGDPDQFPVAKATNSLGETIYVYENAWVAIRQEDGQYDVSRMD
jgi:hypothetical protein